MNPYSFINRYRGSGHKLVGCLGLSAPFTVSVTIAHIFGVIVTNHALLYLFAYQIATNLLCVFICFRWWHNSDDWRYGDKMAKQWFWKGGLSFLLLGYPLGFLLHYAGKRGAEKFHPETYLSKRDAEEIEGAAWGWHNIAVSILHVVGTVTLYMWGM